MTSQCEDVVTIMVGKLILLTRVFETINIPTPAVVIGIRKVSVIFGK